MTDATTSEMHNVCNYIYWAKMNSVELVFTLTPEQMNQCNVSYQRKVYQKFDAAEDLVYQSAFEYLQTLHDFSEVVEGSLSLDDATTFMRYYNMSEAAISEQPSTAPTPMPKFVLYSAHAETVAPILHAFDSPLLLTPEPAAMVMALYYEDLDAEIGSDERFRVQVWFAAHWRIEQDSTLLHEMTGAEFRSYINGKLDGYVIAADLDTKKVEEMCPQTYLKSNPSGYSDPEVFRQELYARFEFTPPSQSFIQ